MSGFIRESRLRNIEVRVDSRDKFYEQLRVSSLPLDGNNGLCCSSSFLAYVDSSSGSSAIGVLPLSSTGKNHVPISAPAYQQPLIRAHTQAVQDIAFSPFDHKLLLSCAGDGKLKSWMIPSEGYIQDETEAHQTIAASRGFALKGIACHPSAGGIIAVRGMRDLSVIDLQSGEEAFCTAAGAFTADIQSISWSYTGNYLLSTGKDKIIRLFDFRQSAAAVLTAPSHTGIRSSRALWLGDSDHFITVGHSQSLDREMLFWDQRSLSKPVKRERLDGSTSAIMPFFDSDLNLLTLAGKGDSNLRLYEYSQAALHPIAAVNVGDVIRGGAMLPKQANDVVNCEVNRFLKLVDAMVQPVSMVVPRKEKKRFHEDLFPPSTCGATAAMTAVQFRAGESFPPNRVPITVAGAIAAAPVTAEPETAVNNQPNESDGSVAATATEAAEAAAELNRPSFRLQSSLKYRHMYGVESPKAATYYNLMPQLSFSDSPLLACSDKYWAVPYQGGGGPIYVSRHSAFGKVEPGCAVLNAHKSPVQDIHFSPFHSGLFASGAGDCKINLWSLPEGDDEPLGDLNGILPTATIGHHVHSIRTCTFHPVVPGLLVSTALDMTVKLYDVAQQATFHSIALNTPEGSQANNLTFSGDGGMFALGCKDRVIRLIDPRLNKGLAGTTSLDKPVLGRNLSIAWCYQHNHTGNILSVSTTGTGMRTIQLWDPRQLAAPTASIPIDNASGQIYPLFDEDTGVCYLVGKGDTIIRYYELTFSGAAQVDCVKSNEFHTSKEPIAGVCMLPKRVCNVRNVETGRLLKLSQDSVVPVSFVTPRAENMKQYFQDDIYAKTRSKTTENTVEMFKEAMASEEEVNSFPRAEYVSLKPADMANASENQVAPTVGKRSSVALRAVFKKQEEDDKQRDHTFNRLQNLAIQHSKYNPNPSGGVKVKQEAKLVEDQTVSDDEWDD